MHYEEVMLTIFNYIELFRSSLDTIAPYHHDELAHLAALHFKHTSKLQPHAYARGLARDLLLPFPPERLLDGGALVREWDPHAVREILDLLDVSRARIAVCAKEHEAAVVGENREWEKERWYGTEYFVQRTSEEFIAKVCFIVFSTR